MPELRRNPQLRPGVAILLAHGKAALVPLAYPQGTSNSIDEATRLRHELVQTSPSVQTRVLGEPAVWSNFQEVAKHQLARGRRSASR